MSDRECQLLVGIYSISLIFPFCSWPAYDYMKLSFPGIEKPLVEGIFFCFWALISIVHYAYSRGSNHAHGAVARIHRCICQAVD